MTDWNRGEYLRQGRSGGSVLIEVMVAMAVVAVLVVPLATGVQTAIERATTLERRIEWSEAGIERRDSDGAWEWGTMLARASWRAGPALDVQIRQGRSTEPAIGLWSDGWFLGEWGLDGCGQACFGPATWAGLTGREVVVRTRDEGSGWGPPWRTVVPDPYGEPPPGATAGELRTEGGEAHAERRPGVVHAPSLGGGQAVASWTGRPAEAGTLGLPLLLPAAVGGLGSVSCDGRSQTWWLEDGRDLDVYF